MTYAPGNIYCADALDFLRGLPDASVDAVITDPPYGIGKAEWDGSIPLHWVEEARRVSPRLIVMTGNPELISVGALLGDVQAVVVMHARNGMTRSNISFGNWIAALVCGDWNWKPRPNYLAFDISTAEDIPHPSPKPIAAMKRLIEAYTEPEWMICDPFAGSGTTLLASLMLGRQFVGCDITPEYVDIARNRIAAWQGIERVYADGMKQLGLFGGEA